MTNIDYPVFVHPLFQGGEEEEMNASADFRFAIHLQITLIKGVEFACRDRGGILSLRVQRRY